AFREAGPLVRDAMVRVHITTASQSTGDITADLATRRGRISGSSTLGGQRARITALVPLAEINDYQSRLKSLTGGVGGFTMDVRHYDAVPARKQQDLMKAFRVVEEN